MLGRDVTDGGFEDFVVVDDGRVGADGEIVGGGHDEAQSTERFVVDADEELVAERLPCDGDVDFGVLEEARAAAGIVEDGIVTRIEGGLHGDVPQRLVRSGRARGYLSVACPAAQRRCVNPGENATVRRKERECVDECTRRVCRSKKDNLTEQFLRRFCPMKFCKREYRRTDQMSPSFGERDSGMIDGGGREGEKIGVACDENASFRPTIRKLLFIAGGCETDIRGDGGVDTALAQTIEDRAFHVLVEMKSQAAHVGARNGLRRFAVCAACFFRSEVPREIVIRADLGVDFRAMIEVVGQGRVNVGERELRKLVDDFLGRASFFVPQDDVLDADAVAGDASFAATCAGGLYDVLFFGGGDHDSIVFGRSGEEQRESPRINLWRPVCRRNVGNRI